MMIIENIGFGFTKAFKSILENPKSNFGFSRILFELWKMILHKIDKVADQNTGSSFIAFNIRYNYKVLFCF